MYAISHKSQSGFLIHIAEGRAGLYSQPADAFSEMEFKTFMEEIEDGVREGRFTAGDVRNAHIGLIHGCGVDLSREEDRNFLKKYGIGLVWSPVSDLILYADTPAHFRYMDDPELMIALGSDWSPTGSKTVWDESRSAYEFIQETGEETKSTRENLLKACTVVPAAVLGESGECGNLCEGAFADLFILRADRDIDGDKEVVLDTFVQADDAAVEAVIVGGEAVYGEEAFLKAYAGEEAFASYGQTGRESGELQSKYFLVPELFGGTDLTYLYSDFEKIMEEADAEISLIRKAEDPYYREVLSRY